MREAAATALEMTAGYERADLYDKHHAGDGVNTLP